MTTEITLIWELDCHGALSLQPRNILTYLLFTL